MGSHERRIQTIAEVLQKVATGTTFEDPQLQPLNKFVAGWSPRMYKLVSDLDVDAARQVRDGGHLDWTVPTDHFEHCMTPMITYLRSHTQQLQDRAALKPRAVEFALAQLLDAALVVKA